MTWLSISTGGLYYLDAIYVAALLLLPSHLREDGKSFFDDDKGMMPHIVCSDAKLDLSNVFDASEFCVVVEGRVVARCKDLVRAFTCLICVFYVYVYVEYPNILQGTYTFVQKFMLQLSDGTETLLRVLTLMNKVKKHVY